MAIFTAWGKDGSAYIFVPGERPRFVDGTSQEDGLELIWRIEATSWDEAMARYHEMQGWEPYRPPSDPQLTRRPSGPRRAGRMP